MNVRSKGFRKNLETKMNLFLRGKMLYLWKRNPGLVHLRFCERLFLGPGRKDVMLISTDGI